MLTLYLSMLDTEEEKRQMTEIYEEHKNFALYIARKTLENNDDAEDAVHSAFLEIINHKQKYFSMGCSDLRASFVIIVRHKTYDIIRKRKKGGKEITVIDSFDNIADETSTPFDGIFLQEEYAMLRQAVKEMTPTYSEILTMKYFENMSNTEIAAKLGTTTKHVETVLYRARASLRKTIDRMKGK